MRNEETNKFIVWLMGAFPAWKADKGVAAVWASEMPDVTAEVAIKAVRGLQGNSPSPFPQGVFEIKAAILGNVKSPLVDAKETWQKIVGIVRRYGKDSGLPEKTRDKTRKSLNAIGGMMTVGNCSESQLPWLEKEFVNMFCEYSRVEKQGETLALTGRTREALETEEAEANELIGNVN